MPVLKFNDPTTKNQKLSFLATFRTFRANFSLRPAIECYEFGVVPKFAQSAFPNNVAVLGGVPSLLLATGRQVFRFSSRHLTAETIKTDRGLLQAISVRICDEGVGRARRRIHQVFAFPSCYIYHGQFIIYVRAIRVRRGPGIYVYRPLHHCFALLFLVGISLGCGAVDFSGGVWVIKIKSRSRVRIVIVFLRRGDSFVVR